MLRGESDGRDALGGAGHTDATVTPQGDRIGEGRVHAGQTVGQPDGDQAGLVVGADPLVGLDEGGVQDRLLGRHTDKIESRKHHD